MGKVFVYKHKNLDTQVSETYFFRSQLRFFTGRSLQSIKPVD